MWTARGTRDSTSGGSMGKRWGHARWPVAMIAGAVLWAAASPGLSAASAPSFTTVPSISSAGSAFRGVSAAAANDVWAVGTVTSPRSYGTGTGSLAEHWNGSSWTVVPSPDTLHNDEILNSVSEVSANDVWAVGQT